jgi:hypothetical protein
MKQRQCTVSAMETHFKGKEQTSLCFNWAPRHEGILGEKRYSSTYSLTSALDGGEWSASRTGPCYPLYRRLDGPQSRSGQGDEEKNSQSQPGLEPSIIQPVT